MRKNEKKKQRAKPISYLLVYVMRSINSWLFITQIPGQGYCFQQILLSIYYVPAPRGAIIEDIDTTSAVWGRETLVKYVIDAFFEKCYNIQLEMFMTAYIREKVWSSLKMFDIITILES